MILPANYGQHIGIMTPSSMASLLVSDQWLLKGCINFIQSLQKGKASLKTGQV